MHLQSTLKKPLSITIAVFLIIVLLEMAAILYLNNGHLTFTLDDPYIHLALAQNMMKGHYGVNLSEFSAPSSSVLWPLIIVPFSQGFLTSYFILLFNSLCSLGTIFVFSKIVLPDSELEPEKSDSLSQGKLITILLILSIPVTNLVGLIYTGMEHSLQVFLSITIVYCMIYEEKYSRWPLWGVFAIILAPCIRYECLALSIPALLYFYFQGYRLKALSTFSFLMFVLCGFSFFLTKIGLRAFPTSIIAKSLVISESAQKKALLEQLYSNLSSNPGILLAIIMAFLLYIAFDGQNSLAKRRFSLAIIVSISLHLMVGRYGWYHRYEIYIWTSSVFALFYLCKEVFYRLFNKKIVIKAFFFLVIPSFWMCSLYFEVLFNTPIAANNIYEQQYQMHRFVVDYYKKPVALNDLGYVSYNNGNYVLDLWGLASLESLKFRSESQGSQWMTAMVDKKNVKLVMIYDEWFQDIPVNWHRLGFLKLSRKRITPAHSTVSFYSVGCEDYAKDIEQLKRFSETLPKGSQQFQFEKPLVSDECLSGV